MKKSIQEMLEDRGVVTTGMSIIGMCAEFFKLGLVVDDYYHVLAGQPCPFHTDQDDRDCPCTKEYDLPIVYDYPDMPDAGPYAYLDDDEAMEMAKRRK